MNEDHRSLGSMRLAAARNARSNGRSFGRAGFASEHLHLVAEDQDLEVLRVAVEAPPNEESSERPDDEEEEVDHQRMVEEPLVRLANPSS
jgi:hypothetical protein